MEFARERTIKSFLLCLHNRIAHPLFFNLQPVVVKISEVENKLDQRVIITGEIKSLKFHENGHIFMRVGDETGEIKVVIFKNVFKGLGKSLHV